MVDDVVLNDRRVAYTASAGQTVFDIDFPISVAGDVIVYQNGSVVDPADYTVDLTALTVTLDTGATLNDSIVIEGDTDPARASSFPRGGDLSSAILNTDFRKVFYILQEQVRNAARRLSLNPAEGAGVSAQLPLLEAGKLIGWSASGLVNIALGSITVAFDAVLSGVANSDFLQYNGTNWVNITVQDMKDALGIKKNNYAATGAPGVGDDSDDGYAVGSRWIDVSADAVYHCVDATVGAAVWVLGDLQASDLGSAAAASLIDDDSFATATAANIASAESTKAYADAAAAAAVAAHDVGADYAALGLDDIGSTIMAENLAGSTKTPGSTIAGTSLRPASAGANDDGSTTMTGTWVCLGYTTGSGGSAVTLWKKTVAA